MAKQKSIKDAASEIEHIKGRPYRRDRSPSIRVSDVISPIRKGRLKAIAEIKDITEGLNSYTQATRSTSGECISCSIHLWTLKIYLLFRCESAKL